MKLMHIADLHIGKSLNQKSLLADQEYVLNQIIDIMEQENCHLLLIAGDVYDKQIPSQEAVKLFNNFLTTLIIEKKYHVYIINGNHDSAERLNFAKEILKTNNLYISCMPQYPLECYQEVEDVKVNIYMLPYVTPLNTRLTFNTDVKTYQEMANFYLERTPLNKDEFNILISHNTVLNNHQALFSDSEYQLSIGGVDEIEASTFKSFDYVALGHLHKAQKVGNNNVYYSGSILKYSESEINYHNGANMIEITKNGINVSTIEFKTLHQMQSICDTFENIMGQAYAASEDYIYITLKNKIVISNAMADIRMKFPNAVSLTYEIYEQDKTTTYKKVNHQEKLSVMDCLKNFYREIFDNDMSEDVVNLAEEIFAKVNENETN